MLLKRFFVSVCFLFFILLLTQCDEPSYTPKPRGFPRIVLPEKGYQSFKENYCAFTFEYPKYAVIEQDKLFFDDKAPSDCWFNIKIASLNAVVHCSYYKIEGQNTFEKLRGDAFQLVGKHNVKADFIEETAIRNNKNVSGFLFNITGPAACPFQFYLTDSTKNFMRGALYFDAAARPDSLAPAIEFLKVDIVQMVSSFEWKK